MSRAWWLQGAALLAVCLFFAGACLYALPQATGAWRPVAIVVGAFHFWNACRVATAMVDEIRHPS